MRMSGLMERSWCFYKFWFQVLILYYWKSWTICSLNFRANSFYELVVCRLSKTFSFTLLGENEKIVKSTIGEFALFFFSYVVYNFTSSPRIWEKKNRGEGVGKEKQYLYSIALELLSMGSLKQLWWWLFMQNIEKNGGWTIEVVRGLHGVNLWKSNRGGWDWLSRLLDSSLGMAPELDFNETYFTEIHIS